MAISSRFAVRSTFVLLLVGLLALLAIVGASFWLQMRSQAYFAQAIEARDTRSAAVELRSAVQTAESSQRGYLVSGNEIYLAPYGTAKAATQRLQGTLKQLLAPYPEMDVPLDRLSAAIADKMDELDQTITLKQARHDDEALALFNTNKGKALMDQANVFFSGIIEQTDARLTSGVGEQRQNAQWLQAVSGIGGIIIILVVGGTAYVLLRYTQEMRQARDEVEALNAELEGRVALRTADLVQARNRAEVLLAEVNHRVANSLALVSSLVSLQSKAVSDETAKKALAETQDRIFAVSLVHRRLYDSSDARMVTLDEYLTGVLEHLETSLRNGAQGVSLTYELEPVKVPTDSGVNLGVIATEWVTNSVKYAYPDGPGGIRVKLRALSGDTAELVVEDDGVGRAEGAPAKGTGLGTRIVTAMAASIGGTIDYVQRQPGTQARLVFPVAGRAAQ